MWNILTFTAILESLCLLVIVGVYAMFNITADNAWLVPATVGLGLDICGIVILVGPLLNTKLTSLTKLSAAVKKNHITLEAHKKTVKKLDPKNPKGSQEIYMAVEVDKIIASLIYQINDMKFNELVITYKNSINARVALVVITTGFLLLIASNFMR